MGKGVAQLKHSNLIMVTSALPGEGKSFTAINLAMSMAAELDLDVAFFQSNHEGALIDRLHHRDFDVAIVNAAGLTHTSVALRDALVGIALPFYEVHLSDPDRREPFRRVNFLRDVAVESIAGLGPAGYHLALERIADRYGGRDG